MKGDEIAGGFSELGLTGNMQLGLIIHSRKVAFCCGIALGSMIR